MPRFSVALAAVGLLGLTACSPEYAQKRSAVKHGQLIYAKECSQCHGVSGEGAGSASLGLGTPAPDLVGLSARNDGVFPREFVRRFILGLLETDDPEAAMPQFAKVGLPHVYPQGGADGEVLEADFEDLLDYLASIQE
ncbi:Cytochrome c family protein [Sulfitobacter noctilucicola]|uniref:Mono/diheme cytochrome c family protein n=1 Tax=Sulfitobacter noctilucicola TaxID=1342301 RepID=A0A7W6Q265_9RHOB|nr:cytochrome c [Sulfitobacter noctilucicola]KIN62692.1 Cytochrome c family protein [Sulfitobacter noctilucicola]MBB4172775.1 mono/diheme cytochrome c family protein [Sulfitobacter noctilucicola]